MVTRIILNETSYHGAGAVKSIVAELAAGNNCPALISYGWDADEIIPHGSTTKIREEHGFTPEAIAEAAAKLLAQ